MHSRAPKSSFSRTPLQLSRLALALAATLGAGFAESATPVEVNGKGGPMLWTDGNLTVNGSITRPTQSSGTALEAHGAGLGILTNNGSIIGPSAFVIDTGSHLRAVHNNGLIADNYDDYYGKTFDNHGTIDAVSNGITGRLDSSGPGLANRVTGSIGAVHNQGIMGGTSGISNQGFIGRLSNSGVIIGSALSLMDSDDGIDNSGTINGIYNTGSIVGNYDTASAIYNSGQIGTLNNSGAIILNYGPIAIENHATIDHIINSGTVIANTYSGQAIGNFNTIGSVQNSGTLSGSSVGIYNRGTLGSVVNSGLLIGARQTGLSNTGALQGLTNSGTITGGKRGIDNAGAIGSLNNSGLVEGGEYALYLQQNASLGSLINSGTLAGNVQNDSKQNLTINGGSNSQYGTLTGATDTQVGDLYNSHSNLVFASGNTLLNDNLNLGAHTAKNTGAQLQIDNRLTLTGNYSQAAKGTLEFGVAPGAVTTGSFNTSSGFGQLKVTGTANLATGSTIGLVPLSDYRFAQGQRFAVIQAATSGTDLNAAQLNYQNAGQYSVTGASVTDSANHQQTDLVLTLGTPLSKATLNAAGPALAGLYSYRGTEASLMSLSNTALATDSSASTQARLNPAATSTAATSASTSTTQQAVNVTFARASSLRGGLASGDAPTATSGLWTQGFGGSLDQDSQGGVAGYHGHYGGAVFGADAQANEDWRVGGLFSYTHSSINNDGNNNGSSATINSYGLFGYASYAGNPWYLDLTAGAVQHQYKTDRAVDPTGLNGVAKADHNGMQYIASAQLGYPFDMGSALFLTPLAGLTASTLRQESYTEHGGNGGALHISPDSSNSLKSDLGLKAEKAFATGYGDLTPSAQLTWRHEYENHDLRSDAYFAADTTGATQFSTTGPKGGADTGVLTLGTKLASEGHFSVSATYSLEAGGGFIGRNGALEARWDF